MNILKCLSGPNPGRVVSEICVEHYAGTLICPSHYDAELLHNGETELKGWGKLDGPAVNVKPAEAAWYVSVPLSEFERIGFDPNELRKSESEDQ